MLAVQWLSVIMPPCKFGEQVLQIQLESFDHHLKIRQLSFHSYRLWVEEYGWIVSLGVEPHLDSHETGEFSPRSPSAARPHAASFSTSLLHFARTSVPASLVHSASLAISLPVCSCSLLLPSYFSRWSLVWFRYPVAFTRWCFGCSRGKQVSILCFYYFPD